MDNLTKKQKKKGFTLVELMAVVAIIAILAVVLVPTVTGYITRSKKVAVISQVRTVVGAVEIYNATATTALSDGTKINTLVNADGTGALNADLKTDDINKLGAMTIGTARAINKDSDAVKKIELNNSGSIIKYDSTTIATQ